MDRHQDGIGISDDSGAGQLASHGDKAVDWVREVIAMTRPGAEIVFPHRGIDEREIPFAYDDFR